jgi:hypothetical protein
LRSLRSLGCQQTFQLAVARDHAHDLGPRRLDEARTQGNVVPKIINADGQPPQSDCWRGRNHIGQRRLFWLLAEAEDRESGHRD